LHCASTQRKIALLAQLSDRPPDHRIAPFPPCKLQGSIPPRRLTVSVLPADLQSLVSTHGCLAVGLMEGLECMGLPLPGETILPRAAIYCGASGDLSIWHEAALAAAARALSPSRVDC